MNTMTPFVQAAIGVVALAFLAVAVAVVRALWRLTKAIDLLTEPTSPMVKLLESASQTSTEVRELVARLEPISENMAAVGERFRDLSDRAFTMSSAILDELEPPVRRAVSLARGVRAGAEILMERWAR